MFPRPGAVPCAGTSNADAAGLRHRQSLLHETSRDAERSSPVYVFNSGSITDGAKEYLLAALGKEPYGDNVHFLDGERLSSLNDWATLSQDTNSRSKMLGLRVSLRVISEALGQYQSAGMSLFPIFIGGLEAYIAEPIQLDEGLLEGLMALWQQLSILKTLNEVHVRYAGGKSPNNLAFLDKSKQSLRETATKALQTVKTLQARVDMLLERLNPI